MVWGGNLHKTHLKCLFFYSDGLSLSQINSSQVYIFSPYCAMYDCFQNIVPWNHQICYKVQARQVPSLTPPWSGMGRLTWVSLTISWKDDKRNLAQNKRKWHKFQKVYFYLHQCQRGGRLYWKIHMHRSLTQQYNSREKVRESQPISVSSKSSWDFFAREMFFLTSRDQLSAGEVLYQLDLIQLVRLEDMRHFGRILWMTPR